MKDRLLNQKEAAAYLSISLRSLERLKLAWKISYIRLSPKCIRYRESDCKAFLDSKYVYATNADSTGKAMNERKMVPMPEPM